MLAQERRAVTRTGGANRAARSHSGTPPIELRFSVMVQSGTISLLLRCIKERLVVTLLLCTFQHVSPTTNRLDGEASEDALLVRGAYLCP